MAIKSSQTLVAEALKTVKTISPEEALKLVSENKCNLIDIRDAFELQREGSVENSFHISRGLLEFAIHPDSVFSQREKLDPNKLLSNKSLSKEKVLEEINELIEAVEKNSNKIHEAADVFYHLIMYLEANEIKIEDVMEELNNRKK